MYSVIISAGENLLLAQTPLKQSRKGSEGRPGRSEDLQKTLCRSLPCLGVELGTLQKKILSAWVITLKIDLAATGWNHGANNIRR
jgi:hypothetical protein